MVISLFIIRILLQYLLKLSLLLFLSATCLSLQCNLIVSGAAEMFFSVS